jgi:hypothetical protein
MKNKTLSLLTLAVSALLCVSQTSSAVSSINLSSFGASVEGDTWTYNPATSTISGNDTGGAILFPSSFTPVNLTTIDNYNGAPTNLRITLTGLVTTSPGGAFTITLEDDLGRTSSTPFTWASWSTNSSTVTNAVTVVSPFNWDNVTAWTLDAGGTGNAVNATFTSLNVTAIPEPSTYALLALSGLALVGYMIRKRRCA